MHQPDAQAGHRASRVVRVADDPEMEAVARLGVLASGSGTILEAVLRQASRSRSSWPTGRAGRWRWPPGQGP